MLTEKQINEIREHLDRAQNPLFFYDNDADGLCSFLLIRRALGRGKGVAIRSYPELKKEYAKKAEELKADYVFILDKPVVSSAFFEEIDRMQLPVVWIDHHDMGDVEKRENVYIYNPAKNHGSDKSFEPVTYLAYKIIGKKEDLWIAVAGCIADHYIPDFAEEFGKQNGELWAKGIKKPFDAYYKTEIGRIAKALNFGIKDSSSNIVKMQNFLINCRSPNEVLIESSENKWFMRKYEEIKKKYDALLERAGENIGHKAIFFDYGGTLSINSEISNELSYKNPGKYVCVAYNKGSITNISLRGRNVKAILGKILKKFENASGGGHEDAVGARIKTEDLAKFKNELEEEIK